MVNNVLATLRKFQLRSAPARADFATAMTHACKPTSSLDDRLASKVDGSHPTKSGAHFNTITGEDWKRSLVSARQRRASASARIQTTISSSGTLTK